MLLPLCCAPAFPAHAAGFRGRSRPPREPISHAQSASSAPLDHFFLEVAQLPDPHFRGPSAVTIVAPKLAPRFCLAASGECLLAHDLVRRTREAAIGDEGIFQNREALLDDLVQYFQLIGGCFATKTSSVRPSFPGKIVVRPKSSWRYKTEVTEYVPC